MTKTQSAKGAEITELLRQYHNAPTPRLRDRIAEINDRLATQAASQAAKNQATPYEDLLQIAREGLLKAIDKFQPALGLSFSSYAIPTIRGELCHHRDRSEDPHTGCKRNQTYAARYAEVNTRHRAWISLGIVRPRSDVALSLGIPLEKWQSIESERTRQNPLALDCAEESPQFEADNGKDYSAVTEALKRMPVDVILACVKFFIEEKTEAAIASELGQSLQTVQNNVQIGRRRIVGECVGTTSNF